MMSVGQQLNAIDQPNAADQPGPKHHNLTDKEHCSVYQAILMRSVDDVPQKGALGEVACLFGINLKTISQIWHQGQQSLAAGVLIVIVESHCSACGQKGLSADVIYAKVT